MPTKCEKKFRSIVDAKKVICKKHFLQKMIFAKKMCKTFTNLIVSYIIRTGVKNANKVQKEVFSTVDEIRVICKKRFLQKMKSAKKCAKKFSNLKVSYIIRTGVKNAN